MATKIVLTVTKGDLTGKSFLYDGKESLILGRQGDCSIVLPESTVSRYHCLLDIAPPSVVVRDFGSLNGTFLNGEKIGRREDGVSAEEARLTRGAEFSMKAGDRLGLGKDCELTLDIQLPRYCADCLREIGESSYTNAQGLPVCSECHERNTNGRPAGRKENEAAQKKRDVRCCEVCGQSLPSHDAPGICPDCQNDPMKVLMFLLGQAKKGVGEAQEIEGYRNIKLLGQGGMGQVWLVEEKKTGKQMALKLMLPKAAADQRSREMFLREAQIAGQLDHRNIVRQYKCGQSGDAYFILMELCDGGSVDALMEKHGGKLSIDLATNILLQVLDGLIYAHAAPLSAQLKSGKTVSVKGIVHRDFKPGNIFLVGSGSSLTAKVADFGLAKAFETAGLSGHTRTGQLAGTPVFMPRQQIINYKESKPAVDVWAAAASYYYMLTGTFAKDFERGKDVIAVALSGAAVPIRKRNPKIPRKLAAVIDRALIEKPAIGVQTAAELKKMIEDAL